MPRSPKCLLAIATLGTALATAPAQASTITVTSTADSGAGSFRSAVAAASASDTVVLPAGTITLASPVVVDKTLTIQGAGARATTLDGNNAVRVLVLQAPAGQVTIQGVKITRGKVTSGDGGGIESSVPLTLRDSAIVGNTTTTGYGGGLSQGAVLTMERTLVAGNSAPTGSGGGIQLEPAGAPTSTITSSTIAQNSASSTGAGINIQNSSAQFLNIINSTLDANTLSSTSAQGGNFRAWSSTTVRLRNTWTGHGISTSGPNCYQAGSAYVISLGHNAQDADDSECNFNVANGDQSNVTALMTPLQDNGGPTDTYALLAGSSLIDAGDAAACATSDQRGVTRPQGAGCDIGAVEHTSPVLGAPVAEAITGTSATITASANAIGLAGTVRVDYGVSTAYGSSATTAIAAGAAPATAGVALAGLTAATTYHYRVTLTTPDGTATSADGTFTTTAGTTPPAGGGGGTTPPAGGGVSSAAKCTVPKLKGLSLARAKKALTKAHCAVGKVKKPKGRAGRGKLVVKTQSPKTGTVLPAGAKVGMTLSKPKAKATHK